MKFNLLSIVAAAAAIGSPFASAAPDPSRLPIGPTPESSPVPSSHVPSSHASTLPTPSPLQVPTNYRLAIAEKLEKEFAEMGFIPRPIDDIMSILELHDDDAEATLDAMIEQEEDGRSEEDDDEGSDFTGNGDELSSSSDEDSSDDMDEEEEEDDDSSTSNVVSNQLSLPPPQVQNRGILGVGIGSSSDSSSAVITLPTRNRGATNRSGSNLQGGVSLSSVSSSATAMEVDTSSSTIGVVASSGGTNSTSTAIVDLTTEDSSDDESVCPLARREAEREARIAAERSRPPRPDYARAAAAAPAPASSATTCQIRSDRALAESLSEEGVVEPCNTEEDTPSPPINQNSTAKVPLKTSEEEKEKEQVEEDRQLCCVIAESEMEAAWGSLCRPCRPTQQPQKKNRPKSPHQYGMQQRRASNQCPPAPKPPAPKPSQKPRLLKGQQTVKKPSQPRKSGKPGCSTPGCTNVAAHRRRGLCRRCADGPTQECSTPGCTRKAAQGRGGLCRQCAGGIRTCSVPGCTANVNIGLKVCRRHHNPCSVPGCDKVGNISSGNGRFCSDHAQSNAPNELAQHRRTISCRHADRYENDPIYRTMHLLRRRFHHALRANGTAYQGKLDLIGCTVDQLLRYFELFGCDSEDRHIDHIMPLASFDLTDPEQVRRAQHWSNLQPLDAADNMSKGSTIPVGFVWNVERGRWMWSEGSGRTNHDLPATGAGDVTMDELFADDDDESDEFDESGDDDE